MPRPAAVHKKVRFHVTLTPELYGRICLLCADPTSETGLRFGAMSEFFEQAAKDRLALLDRQGVVAAAIVANIIEPSALDGQ